MTRRPVSGLLLGVLVNLIGGSTYLVTKVALTGFPPAVVIVLRTLIALPILFLAAPRGWRSKTTRDDWKRIALVGVLGLAAPHLIGTYGLENAASLNGAILIGMEPIGIVILSALVLGERLGRGQVLGIAFAMIGATLVVSEGDLSSVLELSGRSNLLLALSGLLWSIYTVAGKPTLERVPPIAMTASTSLLSLVVLLPLALIELPSIDPARALQVGPIVAVLSLGLVVSFAAAVLWNVSLQSLTATQMAALIFIQPISGALLGALVGDPLPPAILAGAPLVLSGVYLVQFTKPR